MSVHPPVRCVRRLYSFVSQAGENMGFVSVLRAFHISAFVLASGVTAQASISVWDGGTTGSGTAWDIAANWVFDTAPATGDSVQFLATNATTSGGTQLVSGSPIVTGINGTSTFQVGQAVTGTGIPAGTTIASIVSPSSITLSQAATLTGSSSLTIVNAGGLASSPTITLGASRTITELLQQGQGANFTLGSAGDVSSGYALTLTNSSRGGYTGSTLTIASNVNLAPNVTGKSTWASDSGSNNGGIIVTGPVGGTSVVLNKGGAAGTVTLNGANTFTGSVVIDAGTLSLGGTNAYTGTTTASGGTLLVNFNAGAAATPSANIVSSSSVLVLGGIRGGGTMTVNGKNLASSVNSQAFNGTTLNAGASTFNIVNGISSGNTLVTLGTITRAPGATVNFVQPTVNTTIGSQNGYATGTGNDASGILGGYATVSGTDWASSNGTNIVAFTAYASNTWASGSNTTVTTSGAQASDSTTNSLRFNVAAANTLTLSGTNTIASGGILVSSTVGAANLTTITGGTLLGASGKDLVIHQNNAGNSLTIASAISDNTGATGLTKSGAGNLNLTGTLGYTGGTVVNAGTLTLVEGSTNPLASTGAITVTGGTLNFGTGTSQTITGAVSLSGGTISGGTLTNNGTASDVRNGTISSTLAGSAGLTKTTSGIVTLANTTSNTFTGDTTIVEGGVIGGSAANVIAISGNLIIGSAAGGNPASYSNSGNNIAFKNTANLTVYANGTANFGGGAQNLSGTVTILGGMVVGSQIYQNSIVNMTGGTWFATTYGTNNSFTTNASTDTALISGSLNTTNAKTFTVADGSASTDLLVTGGITGVGTSSSLTKAGAGLMALSGAKGYTAATTINAGTLSVDTLSNGTAAATPVTAASGSTTITVGSAAGLAIGQTFYGGGIVAGTTVSAIAGTTVTLSQATTAAIAASTRWFGDTGLASSLGLSTSAASNLVINGSTLQYTGAAASTDRLFTLGTAGATLDASGSGAIAFTNTGAYILAGANTPRNLALTGTNSGANTLAGIIGDNGTGATSIIKNGLGAWTLSGVNTYTGATTINGGILSVGTLANGGASSSIGASISAASSLVLNGGTLQYTGAAASTDRLFTLGTAVGSALDASSSDALTFSNPGAYVLSGANTARTLTLTGSGTANNTLAGIIADNGTGATSVLKNGAGKWILSGVNTYTGGTTITGGTLVTDATGTIGTGSLTITGGAITLGNPSALAGTANLTFAAGLPSGSINLGYTGVKTLAGLTNGTKTLPAGVYTAAQLNAFFGGSVFTGSGSIQVGSWVQVPLGGGGFVIGLVSDSTGADIYCRTDVGGAFRWVPGTGANGQWLSITDTIVPTTTTGSEALMDTSSIAVDPNNANNLYVSVGTPSSTLHGIYASTDRGATWTAINSTFIMDGNGPFRANGERLAVDPNNSNILWFGSTQDGLQKGVKSGSTWTWTQISPTLVPIGQVASGGKAGVTFVSCDANGGTTIVYAGVYDSVGTTGGVYQSPDAGTTWTKATGVTIATPARGQVAPGGTLYVTGNGVVARMVRGGTLADITPATGISYRGLATDPNDPTGNTVYVGQVASSWCKIWRSTGGGASGTWTMQYQNFNNALTVARAEPDGTPALTGYWFGSVSSLLVTPGNSDELWCGDFFGVARTQNAHLLGGASSGNQSVWYMLQRNQDETCVEAVKNAPSGAELMMANADVGGFRFLDISQRPYGAYGSTFSNPGAANMTSLDFCESNNNVWVRSWTGNTLITAGSNDFYGTGAYTKDGGALWMSFGEIDRKVISSGAAGWETWDLTTYLAAQRAAGVTTVTLILSSGTATNSSGSTLSFASKENTTTTIRPYLLLNGSLSVAPSDDVTVAGATPTTPNGSATTIGVSFAYGTVTNERHIYLKFDLSGVSTITSATLNLSRIAATAGIQYPVGVYACADTSWTEATLVWTGKPAPYASSNGQPNYYDPHYRSPAGADLSGGRVAVSSTNPNLLVWMPFSKNVAPNNVPHYSVDHGVTWTPCVGLPAGIMRLKSKSNPSYLIHQLAADRVNGQFYMAHLSASSGNPIVYRSTDGGANWTSAGTISAGTYNIYRAQIVAAPVANDVWYSDDGVSGTTAGGLWRSTDGASSWGSRLANVRAVRQVAFGKAPPGSSYQYSVYFNGYYNGVKGIYRSDDYGATWIALPALPSGISIESLAGDRQVYGSVFFGTGGRGVFQAQ